MAIWSRAANATTLAHIPPLSHNLREAFDRTMVYGPDHGRH